ncbi:VIT and vWA domain-containing protein [Hyalangium rubrum]|uniref:VIT and VWA domain-containing protein n=1 Tax=Hyalangium rubrum TaxID=3103134 RepID=A0ABU5HC62_9BACT|nr:VIT and VWA domain-containing protein [Hyalangium sp. s54d21]MDY7231047.1 VIT and VWA domain-containing protein [Hyalangium sp. s54d21]
MYAPQRLLLLAAFLLPVLASAQGLLLPTSPNARPLAIKSQRVSVEIHDGTAVTRVEQVFQNDGPSQLEAHYIFPLPKGAALSEFYLWVNGQKTKGEVLEKEKATTIYEGIVRRLADPGLLEYVDSDVFRVRVFPVPARGEQKIELAFSQVLNFSSGLYHYHYPLGATAKAQPEDWKLVGGTAKNDFTFSARVRSKVPLRSIYSPTHQMDVSRRDENTALVGLEQVGGADLTKDLDLYFSVSDKAVGLSLLTYKQADEPGYFVALIAPKTEVNPSEVAAKRVTFVIDTSGSMQGNRMQIAKDALKYCVTRLNPQDTFNVVRFSTDVEPLFPALRTANKENIEKAVSFVNQLEAIGGTAIDEALVRGLQDNDGKSPTPHLLLFITDGLPTIGDTDENTIAQHAREARKVKTRLFTFGVGEDLNARLLDRLSAEGTGTSDFVRDGKEFETKISSFYDKVSHPVLSDLALEMASIDAYDLYPRKLPDLFKGTQLVVMGRYRKSGDAKVVLTGYVNGEKRTFDYGTTAPKVDTSDDFIPRLWAIRKVGFLLEEIRLRGEKPELRDEVITLGKKFGIVTPYTSYLVIEDTPVVTNAPPPPPVMRPWDDRPGTPRPEPKGAPMQESAADEDFNGVLSGMTRGGGSASAPAAAPAPAESLSKAEGKSGVAVSRAMKKMKEQERGPSASEPVRVASGRTFIFRDGGWIDSEALTSPGKQFKVKFLSKAYFALLRERPELKAALALGERVVVRVAKDKSVIIGPDGEEGADKLQAFLR